MKKIDVLMDANEFLDEEARKTHDGRLPGGEVVMLGALPNGMQSGMPSVMICMEANDGTRVFAQASMKLFLQAAQMFAHQFPHVLDAQMVFAAKDGQAIIQMVPEGHVGVIGIMPDPGIDPKDPSN